MKKRLDLYGWLMVVVGLVIWIIQTILAGDILGMLTGVTWIAACSLFIVRQMIMSD